MSRPRSIWFALQLVFFASGVAALGCQMIWTRLLGFALGHEAAAMLAVITAFFAGVAAGAWTLRPWIARTLRPARAYALLELAIGVWVAASPLVLPAAASMALRWLGPAPHAWWHWTLVFATTFLVLLPATAAMGATLPALERFATPVTGRAATAGRLYAANTAGAVAGVGLGAFVLIPVCGFRLSLFLLASLPLLGGVAVLALERLATLASDATRTLREPGLVRSPGFSPLSEPAKAGTTNVLRFRHGRQAEAAPHRPRNGDNSSPPGPESSSRVPLLAFATGWLGLGFEVLGIRLLSQVCDNTIYSYASALAVFLLGTAAGAALERAWWRHRPAPDRLRWLLRGLALATVIGAWTALGLPALYRLAEEGLGTDGAELSVAVAVFAVPTVLMGALFSALAQETCGMPGGLSRLVGWNAFGAALAPVSFNVALVPAFGTRWALVILAFAYALLAFERRGRDAIPILAVALATVLLPARFHLLDLPPGTRVQAFREGVADTVAVVATADRHHVLRVNNRFTMGGTASANAERRHAHLPLLLHPRPRRALFLGTGTGITSGAALAHPGLEADTVELVPEVAAVLDEFAPENRLRDWPARLRLQVADARRYVRSTTNTYDVIVADLFHPARDGAGALYTVEHFAALRARLTPGGVCCQWLPLYQLDEPTLRLILRTFLAVFPDTHALLLRLNLDTPVVGLVGTPSALKYPPDGIEKRTVDPTLREALQPLALTDTVQLLGLVLAGPDRLRRYAGTGPLNTDDRPLVVFTAPGRGERPGRPPAHRLFAFLEGVGTDAALFTGLLGPTDGAGDLARRLSRYAAARDAYLRGLAEEQAGRGDAALARLLESVRLSPDFSTGYAHCLTLAVQWLDEQPEKARRLLEDLRNAQPQRPAARELLRRWSETQ